VQAFPSSQAFALFVWAQPVTGSQLSVVQAFPSSQLAAVPAQTPSEHVSPVVHALPSEQAAALFVWTQPAWGSQLSVVQGLLSLQSAAGPGRHAPNAHASPVVQTLPSSHASALLAKTHPVAGLQLSVVQRLPSSHASGTPAHAPAEQVSPVVHAFPSLQALALFVKTQPATGSHVSLVHTLLSPHTFGPPGWQAPPEHTSLTVHAFPSEQTLVLSALTQPKAVSHESVVQMFPSLQFSGVPA
jgi:hypothetical protein